MRRRKQHRVDDLVEHTLDGTAMPTGELDPGDSDVLRTAIELRAARPGADLPDADFVTRLRNQVAAVAEPAEPAAAAPWSRRSLLARAAAVAAGGVAVGAVVGHEAASGGSAAPTASGPAGNLDPNAGSWIQVANSTDLGTGESHRFDTNNVIGFVTEHRGELVAVSGVCTHLGCQLRANNEAGRLDCPCHRTSFAPDGSVEFSQLTPSPRSLPTLQVRNREGAVEVFLPDES
jgi:cytochrome b6-f complex iron-sulfur subunit